MKTVIEMALEALEPFTTPNWAGTGVDKANEAITALREALNAPHPAQQEPVAFLANGTRFKISYDSRQSGGQIHGIPPELGGRWVAFVAADDDCHLKLISPPAQRTWVELTDEEMSDLQDRCGISIHQSDFQAIEAKLKEKNT